MQQIIRNQHIASVHIYLSLCLYVYLCVCLSIHLCIYLSVCLPVCIGLNDDPVKLWSHWQGMNTHRQWQRVTATFDHVHNVDSLTATSIIQRSSTSAANCTTHRLRHSSLTWSVSHTSKTKVLPVLQGPIVQWSSPFYQVLSRTPAEAARPQQWD